MSASLEKLRSLFSGWVTWRIGPARKDKDGNPGKFTKIPINPVTGNQAKVNDPETFGTYEQAQAAFTGGGYDGMGALLASGGDVVVVDIDDCIDAEGNPADVAQAAFEIFGETYCEISQSGKGLHFIMRGILPEWTTREKVTVAGHSVEVYTKDSARFMSLTGNELQDHDVIENQEAFEIFLLKFGFDVGAKAPGAAHPLPLTDTNTDTDSEAHGDKHSDAEIIALMLKHKSRAKVARLLAGDLKDYNGDNSAADLGLCSLIAFYVKDADQIARIFEHSELSKRDKWKKRTAYRRTP